MLPCQAPLSDATLIDYLVRDLPEDDETNRVEEHLFACADCSARLDQIAALGTSWPRSCVKATPAAVVQQLPSMRLELTLTSAGAAPTELGRYVLEHSASTHS